MLRRCAGAVGGLAGLTGSLPTTGSSSQCLSVAPAAQSGARFSLAVHTPKSEVNLEQFHFMQNYNEFRDRSGRVPDHYVEKYRSTYWRVDEYIRRAENYIRAQGFFFLPALDFPWYKGCMPLFSSYQIRVHYSRHHRAYVDKLNQLVEGTPLYGLPLDELIRKSADDLPRLQGVFNNAAQHFNHSFFWKCVQPVGSNIPPDLAAAVESQYGSVKAFKESFLSSGLSLFGSGWVYWVYNTNAKALEIIPYSNAGCPLTKPELVPLLCVDVWEHAYYIDYENDRAKYLSKFFDVVDWHWAERHYKRARGEEYHEMAWS